MLITAAQLLTSVLILETRCSYCKTTLEEGDRISAYAVRYAGDEEWSIPRLYCRDCRMTITDPTLDAIELLAEGYLGIRMNAAPNRHR